MTVWDALVRAGAYITPICESFSSVNVPIFVTDGGNGVKKVLIDNHILYAEKRGSGMLIFKYAVTTSDLGQPAL